MPVTDEPHSARGNEREQRDERERRRKGETGEKGGVEENGGHLDGDALGSQGSRFEFMPSCKGEVREWAWPRPRLRC